VDVLVAFVAFGVFVAFGSFGVLGSLAGLAIGLVLVSIYVGLEVEVLVI
jgi:hypothetical protein